MAFFYSFHVESFLCVSSDVGILQKLIQFPEFENVPIDTLTYTNAHCEHVYNGTSYHAVCQSADIRVELEWTDVLDRKQVVWPGFPAGDTAYDLTTVICPCGEARIQVNDKRVDGEVQTLKADDGFFRSTAFMAFAETWIGPLNKADT